MRPNHLNISMRGSIEKVIVAFRAIIGALDVDNERIGAILWLERVRKRGCGCKTEEEGHEEE